MRRLRRLKGASLTLAAFGALSCSGSTSDDGSPADTAETSGEADADTDADTDTDTDADADAATLTGYVVDLDGKAVSGARVNICRDVCITDMSDDQGAYTLVTPYPETQAFYTVPPADSGLATPIAPHTPAMGQTVEIDVVMPALDPAQDLPPTAREVEVTDGLFLTVGADILEPAGVEELGEEVAAAPVSAEHSLPLELDGEVVAQWYVEPFEATSETGVELRLANQWSLPAGATYEVMVAGDPYDPGWIEAGTLTVSSDGQTLEGDAQLAVLTSVVLLAQGE